MKSTIKDWSSVDCVSASLSSITSSITLFLFFVVTILWFLGPTLEFTSCFLLYSCPPIISFFLLVNILVSSLGFSIRCLFICFIFLKELISRNKLKKILCWRLLESLMIGGSRRITGSWIPRAPMKGFWWHLHVGSSLTSYLLNPIPLMMLTPNDCVVSNF